MRLSNQAAGALMMALQKCIMEQADIMPILGEMNFDVDEEGQLYVKNPPRIRAETGDLQDAEV